MAGVGLTSIAEAFPPSSFFLPPPSLPLSPPLLPSFRSAGHWWLESLTKLLQLKDPLNSWRKLAAGGGGGVDRDPLLDGCGVWGCLLGAILATKLAR